jgi:hypothetical protein
MPNFLLFRCFPLIFTFESIKELESTLDHYFKHYDIQLHALQFQNLQTSTILVEKIYMFSIIGVLLYDAIPCTDLKDLCKEAT